MIRRASFIFAWGFMAFSFLDLAQGKFLLSFVDVVIARIAAEVWKRTHDPRR